MEGGDVVEITWRRGFEEEAKAVKKTICDPDKVARLLALAAAVPDQPPLGLCVSWAPTVEVRKTKLPRPVGVFKNAQVETWGSTMRHPSFVDRMEYMSGKEASALSAYIQLLWSGKETDQPSAGQAPSKPKPPPS